MRTPGHFSELQAQLPSWKHFADVLPEKETRKTTATAT